MKQALIAGAALTACPTILVRKAPAAWARRTIVHPQVENLRVVGLTDVSMTTAYETGSSWTRQNELVNSAAVWHNIDRLACALAQTRNPTEAWRQIFIKPPRASWSETVVAIKTNNIAQQHTRSAVMAKIVNTPHRYPRGETVQYPHLRRLPRRRNGYAHTVCRSPRRIAY